MELKGCTHVRDFSLLSLSLSKLDISDCNLFAEGGKALAAGLKGNQAITELNVSNNSLGKGSGRGADISGIIAIADVIGDGALSKLIFGGDRCYDHETDEVDMSEPAILEVGMSEADFSNRNLGAGGAIIIAAWITHKDRGAMSKLVLSANGLLSKESGKVLAEMLKHNSVLQELDVSDNYQSTLRSITDGPGFAQELAVGLSDNGALLVLSLKDNGLATKEAGEAIGEMLLANTVLKELDISCNAKGYSWEDPPGFAMGISKGLSGNGAMTSLHVGMNAIPEKEMKEIIVIAMSKDNMKLLCEVPIKDKTLTELDVSGKSLGTEGALVVAEYLRDNGALTTLDISRNSIPSKQEGELQRICAAGGTELAI
jgi:Ran GTPase-activating protein (RanGAP) involved in mRNA processing and transport